MSTENAMARFKDRKTEYWTYPRMSIGGAAIDPDTYLAFLDEAPADDSPLRVYLHIPFCRQFCAFCPYFKNVYRTAAAAERLKLFEAFAREIAMYASRPQIAGRAVASIYFGGGDPGVISIEEHDLLWRALRASFDWAPHVDITMEGTALSFLDGEKLAYFKEMGVTRTSFGVQTFDESIRPQLNLEPTILQIHEAAQRLRQRGFEVNVDMMYNLPGQTDESLARDLALLRGLDPTYVDFYALQTYPNTAFLEKVRAGAYGDPPTNEKGLRLWLAILTQLDAARWNQVSSVTFSRTRTEPHRGFGHTLRGLPRIAIGPSARSFVCGRNFRNHSSNERYVEEVRRGRLPIEAASRCSAETAENSPFVFFPIRLFVEWATVEASPRNRAIVEQLMREGYVERRGELATLTTEGRAWVGNLQREFFDENERRHERVALFHALRTGRNPYNEDFMGVSHARAEP
jgi:oxygen-independent coproporphyrinogen-3 oxidase